MNKIKSQSISRWDGDYLNNFIKNYAKIYHLKILFSNDIFQFILIYFYEINIFKFVPASFFILGKHDVQHITFPLYIFFEPLDNCW